LGCFGHFQVRKREEGLQRCNRSSAGAAKTHARVRCGGGGSGAGVGRRC
jgi:hypothetical protein